LQVRQATSVSGHQSAGINAARVDEVILRTIRARQTRSVTVAVTDNVTLRRWLVLQLDCEVVESGLLIVEADVAILVKLPSRKDLHLDRRRARSSARARRIHATNFNGCGNRLATDVSGAHRNARGALTAGDGSGRNRPVVGRIDLRCSLLEVRSERCRAIRLSFSRTADGNRRANQNQVRNRRNPRWLRSW